MSYSITIDFYPNISPDNLLSSIQEICTEIDKQIPERIDKNIGACLVHPFHVDDESFKEFSRTSTFHLGILNFIEHFFQHSFFYYAQYHLLGIVTRNEESPVSKEAVRVQFQNSCDQDYSLDTWDGIPVFEEIRDRVLGECSGNPDLNEYDIRTKIYGEIEETMEIDKYLWHPDDFHPQSFAISFVNERQKYQYYTHCRKLLRDIWREWESEA